MDELKQWKQFAQKLRKDYKLFAEKNLYIATKEIGIVPFKFKPFQVKLWRILEKALATGKPIRWIILKARQMGISTFIEGFIYWRISLNKATNALVVAHKLDSAEHILGMEQMFYEKSLPQLRPHQQKSNRKEIVFAKPSSEPGEAEGLNSRVLIGTADDEDLGASYTLHLAHLSEFARWDRVTKNMVNTLGSLTQTIKKTAGTAIFIESTAQGHNFFKEMWDDKNNGYEKIFLSWLAEPDYRKEIRPDEYFALQGGVADRYGDEVDEAEAIERELKFWYEELAEDTAEARSKLTHEIMCRLAWRRTCIDENCFGNLALFRQEYPTRPEDAFIGKGSMVFDGYALQDMEKDTEVPSKRFTFDNACLDLRETTTGRKTWWRKAFISSVRGELTVYEAPKAHETYVLAIDASDGIVDPTSMKVFKVGMPQIEEVAHYTNETITPDDLAYVAYALGGLYGFAYLGIEANKPGMETIRLLTKTLFYPNLYKRQVFDSMTKTRVDKIGWYTSPSSKPILISALALLIRERWITIHTPETLKQLRYYKKTEAEDLDSNKAKYGAPSGKHDDDVITCAIGAILARDTRIGKPRAVRPDPMSAEEIVKRNERRMAYRSHPMNNRTFGSIEHGIPFD